MMRNLGINFNVNVNVADLLVKLKANRTQHQKVYAESVEGFKDHAMSRIRSALELTTGKEDIAIHLSAPRNYTAAYDTAISALTMHQEAGNETIGLDASTFRKMAEDKWDWMDEFLISNSDYSATAAQMSSDQ